MRLVAPPSDAQLVESIRSGDRGALGAMFDRYGSHVRRTLYRVLGPDPDSTDVLHDVFVTVMERIDQLGDPAALKGWLTSVTIFTARGRIRRRRRWRGFLIFSEEAVSEHSSSDPGPVVSAEHRALYDVLDRMPVDERIVLCLRFLSDMQVGEIANACGFSHATAKRRIARARARFDRLAERHPVLRERRGEVPS